MSLLTTPSQPPDLINRPKTQLNLTQLPRPTQQFNHQYSRAYSLRLAAFRPKLEEKVKKEWNVEFKMISALCESDQSSPRKSPRKSGPKIVNSENHAQHITCREDLEVAIIGTLFKIQPDKPSILQELIEEIDELSFKKEKSNYTSAEDILIMEDETTRVRLVPGPGSGMTIGNVVNGIVCAVKGKPNLDGMFEVDQVIWGTGKLGEGGKVPEMLLISGLSFTNDLKTSMLFDYLQGLAGSSYEQNLVGQKIVVFLGNSFPHIDPNDPEKFKLTADIAKSLDEVMAGVAKSTPVYLLPGPSDPTTPMLPQPPIHSCLFPLTSQFSFHLLPNPAKISGLIFSSGESVLDALKFSTITSPLEMGKKLLEWGHLCPTAPDTLALHPGMTKDEFVIDELPNLFAFGGLEGGMISWGGVKIVEVPDFGTSGKIGVLSGGEFIEMGFGVEV